MKIKCLDLQNFMGLKSGRWDFDGENCTVYGDNGIGKTRLASAWSWLWFGKDVENKSNFEIKPIVNEQVQHHVDVSVEACVIIDETEYTFKKI